MTDTTNEDLPQVDELTALKQRAQTMGLKYHPSISVERLREKVLKALETDGPVVQEEEEQETKPTVQTKADPVKSRAELAMEATKLVRIRLTCMNPAKKDWHGELFTAGNALVKTQTKFVPFDNDEGWHVPQIILNVIKNRKCQVFIPKKDKFGNEIKFPKMVKEFGIEIMEPLTKDEIQELAQRQQMGRTPD